MTLDHAHPGPVTPTSIRDETFHRRVMGLDADQVYAYLDLVADRLKAVERERSHVLEENARLRSELEQVRAELTEHQEADGRVNEQVVQLFSQAQLVAEEMVEGVSRDARERLDQVRAHEREIVEVAMAEAGQQVRTYAQRAQAQMQSIVESFATEVDRLGAAPDDRPGTET